MSKTDEETVSEAKGSGGHTIAGYDYQIDVSVWLALDLILASKLTQQVVLEPASQEDLETELSKTEPGRATNKASLEGYTLIVQAKLRSGDAWTVNSIRSLLEYGSETRPSAKDRLSASNARYLLVTSAGLNGRTRGLRVRHAGEWPAAADMPTSIADSLPSGSAGRVAVICNQDEERLATDIKQLLTDSFRVPNARTVACLNVLREEALIRIRKGGSGSWERDELEYVIRKHEGYIASSPELDHYVHPTNWGDLRAAIAKHHGALIIGQSGTGKTLATLKLYEELREEISGLSRVAITLGPRQLSNDRTEPPVLYDIEDPWGRFDFDPTSRPWNDQLANFFSRATHDRLIVATSRRDVGLSSGALDSLNPWTVPLEAEHYGKAERYKLYESRIDALPRDLQVVATQAKIEVMSKLATPLEIQKFFDALATIDIEHRKNPSVFISKAIRRAHQDSIERTVIEQIEVREDVRAAAVVWGLLKAADKLSLRVVRMIENGLADRDAAMSNGVMPLIRFFVAARNLRQSDTIFTYYHPRVEAGIEQTLERYPLIVARTLRQLIELLASPNEATQEWGPASAAKLLAAVDNYPALKPVPNAESAARIDAWLAARLIRGGDEFRETLRLASAAGSTDSIVSEVARYLLNRPDKTFPGIGQWGPPQKDEAWYARLRADPSTKPLVELFVRQILPTEPAAYGPSFATDIERLSPNLSDAFVAAALRSVDSAYFSSIQAIAKGALRNLDHFEAVVDAAVKVVSLYDEDRPEMREERLAIVNREYSEDHIEAIRDNDHGHAAYEFLEAYVYHVRATGEWRNLTQHRHCDRLLFYWLRDLANEESSDLDEVAGAFRVSYEGKHEHLLWIVMSRAWNCRYLDTLTTRLVDGHNDREVRRAAISCLVQHAPLELANIGRVLIDRGDIVRLVEVAIDLAHLCKLESPDDGRHQSGASKALATLSKPLVELSNAQLALQEDTTPVLSEQARVMLETARGGSTDVRRFRVALDGTVTLEIEDDVQWLLANVDEADIAILAIEAAIRWGMAPDVEAALDHKFARVSARALTALGESMHAPLTARLLAKAHDKGSPVRKALVALLDTKPHVMHVPTLLHLARDTWSDCAFYYDDDAVNYPIAQAAVAALEKFESLAPNSSEELYGIAIGTYDAAVRSAIFRLLAKKASLTYQHRLFDLAVTPGRDVITQTAATALLLASAHLPAQVIARITPELLERSEIPAPVAVRLTLLFAWRADIGAVHRAAEILAVHPKRRVLVVLLTSLINDRDSETANLLAAMLPEGHAGVAWALGAKVDVLDDALLADLGDPATCAAALFFMNLKINGNLSQN